MGCSIAGVTKVKEVEFHEKLRYITQSETSNDSVSTEYKPQYTAQNSYTTPESSDGYGKQKSDSYPMNYVDPEAEPIVLPTINVQERPSSYAPY
tara:strand:- start:331 stop:612 length:282 start_codon:yes stop_codon:yes gene_type:complete